MICINELTTQKCNVRIVLEPLTVLLSPFAPHISEELWFLLGNNSSLAKVAYPVFDVSYLVESSKNYPISFNGKMRFTIKLDLALNQEEIEGFVLNNENTIQQLKGKVPKKVIIIPGKIVNIVF